MNGKWFAPAIGNTKTPFGLDGEGTLEWNADGVRVTGLLQSKNAASVFGCLGFIVGMAVAITLSVMIAKDVKFGAALGLLGLPLGVRVGRMLFPARQVNLTWPWAQLDGFGIDERTQPGVALLTFSVKGSFFKPGTPAGALYFVPAASEGTVHDALKQLETARAITRP